MTLKELRMWHWQCALEFRGMANGAGRSKAERETLHSEADFHIAAVQCLNDYVPGTAEEDCKQLTKGLN